MSSGWEGAVSMSARQKERPAPIDSIDTLRRRVPEIVRQLNEQPALALRAAANPILALAEMGYQLTDRLAREVELRLRFTPAAITRLDALRERLGELAGEPFDPDNTAELRRTLFERLELPHLPPRGEAIVVAAGPLARQVPATPRDELEFPWVPPGGIRHPDPLEPLRKAHPIIEPLIEYRAIQASQPRLATKEIFERLARGELAGPTFRIRARLKDEPPE